ncbi:MAG: type I restriction enzyme HsdR N-terminal domain-containing protein [Chloroflexi bacterium]|nr:type I restriction enzyme HsdR N-terminal domain-containing protein [Chloroflexota bacterium]
MDFIDRIRELSAQVPRLMNGDLIKTEEGTKNALVMPFINALGYNVFDPTEVTPELVADVGTKKGEKVDYAVLKDRKPIMLFEVKCCGVNLNEVHASQLYRYFSVTDARFGILTDGVYYRFYTDLEAPNKMDERPFFVFNLLDVTETAVTELKKFTKPAFDLSNIITTAAELKYKREIKRYLAAQLTEPTDEFVRLLLEGSGVYTGRKTAAVLGDFRNIAQSAFQQFITEQIESKFKSLIGGDVKLPPSDSASSTEEIPATPVPVVDEKVVTTTPEENEAFLVVRAILREAVDVKRITLRDAQSYCAILLDDNNRRTIVRLYFNSAKKSMVFLDEQRQEERVHIESIDDLYKYADRFKTALTVVLNMKK